MGAPTVVSIGASRPAGLILVKTPREPEVVLNIVAADHMGIGLAIHEQPRSAIVKDHVAVISLTPTHDITGKESGALSFCNRERLGRLAGLRDVALRMEAQWRQRHPVRILLPVDHAATGFGGIRTQHDSTAFGERDRQIKIPSGGRLGGYVDVVGDGEVREVHQPRTIHVVILETQQGAEERTEWHPSLRFSSTIDGDLNGQIIDRFIAKHEPHMAHTARSCGIEDLYRLPRCQVEVGRSAPGTEVGGQLQQWHRRIGVGGRKRGQLLHPGAEGRKSGNHKDPGPEDHS